MASATVLATSGSESLSCDRDKEMKFDTTPAKPPSIEHLAAQWKAQREAAEARLTVEERLSLHTVAAWRARRQAAEARLRAVLSVFPKARDGASVMGRTLAVEECFPRL